VITEQGSTEYNTLYTEYKEESTEYSSVSTRNNEENIKINTGYHDNESTEYNEKST